MSAAVNTAANNLLARKLLLPDIAQNTYHVRPLGRTANIVSNPVAQNYSWKSPSCGGPGGQAARSAIAAAMRPTVAASETSGGIA